MPGVVIVGGGLAGAQTAIALRRNGFKDPVRLIGEELVVPYQPPPLSKAYLKGAIDASRVHLRPEAFWQDNNLELSMGTPVSEIDRDARAVKLVDGTEIDYEHLVLATGASNRALPGAAALAGVLDLRTLDDATALRP